MTTAGNHIIKSNPLDPASTLKIEESLTTAEQAKGLLILKAQLFLSCALSMEEMERVDDFKPTKKVLDTLKTHHGRTNHVKWKPLARCTQGSQE